VTKRKISKTDWVLEAIQGIIIHPVNGRQSLATQELKLNFHSIGKNWNFWEPE
jgi:hypothetical protein